jgi:hypothetical protein
LFLALAVGLGLLRRNWKSNAPPTQGVVAEGKELNDTLLDLLVVCIQRGGSISPRDRGGGRRSSRRGRSRSRSSDGGRGNGRNRRRRGGNGELQADLKVEEKLYTNGRVADCVHSKLDGAKAIANGRALVLGVLDAESEGVGATAHPRLAWLVKEDIVDGFLGGRLVVSRPLEAKAQE